MPNELYLVSTRTLEKLRDDIHSERLRLPLDEVALASCGFPHQRPILLDTFSGHKRAACMAILDAALEERAHRPATPELVWSGPDAAHGTSRDTAVVLREMFEGAREQVILAGYSFTRGSGILEPLRRNMMENGVAVDFFINIEQRKSRCDWESYLAKKAQEFLQEAWPFPKPRPTVYYDVRAEQIGHWVQTSTPDDAGFVSMHAKCVVVDGRQAFISSANFTERAQEKNIECGVLLTDPSFAASLAKQWTRLIEGGFMKRLDFGD